jgi:hypothetical protein
MKPGDLVVLKLGTNCVYGVGEIVGSYEWLDEFSDVDGWDLQHLRRVRWLWKGNKNPKVFNTYDLKFGDTTQLLDGASAVVPWMQSLQISESEYTRELKPLPRCQTKNQIEEEIIADYLYDKGVASDSIENLMREFGELTRIAKWYVRTNAPSESETVAYLVVPLLRALGWSPQKMALEWNNVDLAIFNKLPRCNENLSIVIEAKKKGYSCLSALSQAQTYALNKPNCKRLIVTEGIRYGIYTKKNDSFELYAYMNLTNFQNEYPIYNCFGIKEALRAMTPEWDE